jgi:hypothetical protein
MLSDMLKGRESETGSKEVIVKISKLLSTPAPEAGPLAHVCENFGLDGDLALTRDGGPGVG